MKIYLRIVCINCIPLSCFICEFPWEEMSVHSIAAAHTTASRSGKVK